MPPTRKPCKEEGCDRPKMRDKHRCGWHYLLTLSTDEQVRYADRRLKLKEERPDFVRRSRVAPADWPEGTRFCSGCQCFIPLFYASGSRCKACASRAAHASRIESTYEITREEYEELLAWQGGVCYICGQVPRGRRLAVDHDHVTNAVRGLLCANDEWGCNMSLRRLLDDLAMARRAYDYVTRSPMERMKGGELSPAAPRPTRAMQIMAAVSPATAAAAGWPGHPRPV